MLGLLLNFINKLDAICLKIDTTRVSLEWRLYHKSLDPISRYAYLHDFITGLHQLDAHLSNIIAPNGCFVYAINALSLKNEYKCRIGRYLITTRNNETEMCISLLMNNVQRHWTHLVKCHLYGNLISK